jgi:hypothetical protein
MALAGCAGLPDLAAGVRPDGPAGANAALKVASPGAKFGHTKIVGKSVLVKGAERG